MKNQKELKENRHKMMEKVRNELSTVNRRRYLIEQMTRKPESVKNYDLFLAVLQKKDYIYGLESFYKQLALNISCLKEQSAAQTKFLEFVRKNDLI